MTVEISTALTLLVTGMITVFVVLLLVVTTGNLLIRFVNAYLDDPETPGNSNQINKSKIAAINAAVEIVTEGTGIVEKIERKK